MHSLLCEIHKVSVERVLYCFHFEFIPVSRRSVGLARHDDGRLLSVYSRRTGSVPHVSEISVEFLFIGIWSIH